MTTRKITAIAFMFCAMLMTATPMTSMAASVGDQAIEQAIVQAIGSYSDGVNVQVEDGKVFLSGKVPTNDDLKYVELKARQVPGVRLVHMDVGYEYNMGI